MSRIIAAVILVSALAGCMTSEGPYSRSAITSLEPQRAAPVATNRPAKPTQTAEAPRAANRPAKPTQTAEAPRATNRPAKPTQTAEAPRQIQRAEYPIILGTAF
jgi:hypothetical protein